MAAAAFLAIVPFGDQQADPSPSPSPSSTPVPVVVPASSAHAALLSFYQETNGQAWGADYSEHWLSGHPCDALGTSTDISGDDSDSDSGPASPPSPMQPPLQPSPPAWPVCHGPNNQCLEVEQLSSDGTDGCILSTDSRLCICTDNYEIPTNCERGELPTDAATQPRQYSPLKGCRLTTNVPFYLDPVSFTTRSGDILTINGQNHSGSLLHGQALAAGSVLEWAPNAQDAETGFQLCFSPMYPSPPPSPPSPPPPPPPPPWPPPPPFAPLTLVSLGTAIYRTQSGGGNWSDWSDFPPSFLNESTLFGDGLDFDAAHAFFVTSVSNQSLLKLAATAAIEPCARITQLDVGVLPRTRGDVNIGIVAIHPQAASDVLVDMYSEANLSATGSGLRMVDVYDATEVCSVTLALTFAFNARIALSQLRLHGVPQPRLRLEHLPYTNEDSCPTPRDFCIEQTGIGDIDSRCGTLADDPTEMCLAGCISNPTSDSDSNDCSSSSCCSALPCMAGAHPDQPANMTWAGLTRCNQAVEPLSAMPSLLDAGNAFDGDEDTHLARAFNRFPAGVIDGTVECAPNYPGLSCPAESGERHVWTFAAAAITTSSGEATCSRLARVRVKFRDGWQWNRWKDAAIADLNGLVKVWGYTQDVDSLPGPEDADWERTNEDGRAGDVSLEPPWHEVLTMRATTGRMRYNSTVHVDVLMPDGAPDVCAVGVALVTTPDDVSCEGMPCAEPSVVPWVSEIEVYGTTAPLPPPPSAPGSPPPPPPAPPARPPSRPPLPIAPPPHSYTEIVLKERSWLELEWNSCAQHPCDITQATVTRNADAVQQQAECNDAAVAGNVSLCSNTPTSGKIKRRVVVSELVQGNDDETHQCGRVSVLCFETQRLTGPANLTISAGTCGANDGDTNGVLSGQGITSCAAADAAECACADRTSLLQLMLRDSDGEQCYDVNATETDICYLRMAIEIGTDTDVRLFNFRAFGETQAQFALTPASQISGRCYGTPHQGCDGSHVTTPREHCPVVRDHCGATEAERDDVCSADPFCKEGCKQRTETGTDDCHGLNNDAAFPCCDENDIVCGDAACTQPVDANMQVAPENHDPAFAFSTQGNRRFSRYFNNISDATTPVWSFAGAAISLASALATEGASHRSCGRIGRIRFSLTYGWDFQEQVWAETPHAYFGLIRRPVVASHVERTRGLIKFFASPMTVDEAAAAWQDPLFVNGAMANESSLRGWTALYAVADQTTLTSCDTSEQDCGSAHAHSSTNEIVIDVPDTFCSFGVLLAATPVDLATHNDDLLAFVERVSLFEATEPSPPSPPAPPPAPPALPSPPTSPPAPSQPIRMFDTFLFVFHPYSSSYTDMNVKLRLDEFRFFDRDYSAMEPARILQVARPVTSPAQHVAAAAG